MYDSFLLVVSLYLINIYKLFDDIKDRLTEECRIRTFTINDVYDIPYPNIGKSSNILRVVTLPNTTQILTMFPLEQSEHNLTDDELFTVPKKRVRK